MENTKYIYEVTGEREMLMGTGETMEILAHIGRQIQIIHERMKSKIPARQRRFERPSLRWCLTRRAPSGHPVQ